MASGAAELVLSNGPADSITTVKFASNSNNLLVSSWDKSVRLFDAQQNRKLCQYEHKAAVLDCCFTYDNAKSFSGGLDCELLTADLATGRTELLGDHLETIQCVEHSPDTNLVYTGSWDKTVKAWDPRAPMADVASCDLEGMVYTMSLLGNNLVVGTANRHVYIFDIRSMNEPEQTRMSPLKQMTRYIKCHPDGSGFVLTSIEGRVAVEFFDVAREVQEKKFAFKCHRQTDMEGVQTVFPVNCVAFHPKYHTFATGGCDGVINVWDGNSKKRISQFEKYRMGISTMDFNRDGTLLALAVSYTWEVGDVQHDTDKVFVRSVRQQEVQPKAKRK